MAVIDINWNPSRRELRQFGGLCLVFFGLIAGYAYYRHDATTVASVLGGLAVVLGTMGAVAPAALRPVFVGWMVAAFPIGWTISHLLLGLLYYGILTPIGLILRAVGYDPMNRELDPKASSYWSQREPVEDVGRYFRQF